jgi:diacylglycerol O-acyltransferase
MKQLSGMDNLFLAMDQGHQHMHVAGLGIYDPSTAPGGKVRFKSILNFFVNRLHASKVFRRRLVLVPQDLDRPYWVEDGEIDIEYHVRHIALPQPGDWRQLMIQVARIHSRALDMTKPLWEAYIIEGLDNIPGIPHGSFGVYIKFHHAAVDGEAGAVIIQALHALSPEEGLEEAADTAVTIADRDPNAIELYTRTIGSRARQAVDASKLVLAVGTRIASFGREMIASGRAAELGMELLAKRGQGEPEAGARGRDMAGRKPHTRFDHPVSAHRVVDAVGFSLADCKTIRQHVPEVTINDIFMAACGGALRAYLDAKGELPKKTLNAMVPMTTRGDVKDADAGNQIGMTSMPLRTDVADPIERLLAVRRGSGKSKALTAALGKELPGRLIQVLPAMASKLLIRKGLLALANVTVSNVRGPNIPLYMAGARLVLYLPVSIAFDNLGLNITGFSYHGTLWVCFISCRKMMPDPGFFAQCLTRSFDETVQAATALGATKPARASAPVKPAAAPRKPAKAKAKAAPPMATTAKRATPKAAKGKKATPKATAKSATRSRRTVRRAASA